MGRPARSAGRSPRRAFWREAVAAHRCDNGVDRASLHRPQGYCRCSATGADPVVHVNSNVGPLGPGREFEPRRQTVVVGKVEAGFATPAGRMASRQSNHGHQRNPPPRPSVGIQSRTLKLIRISDVGCTTLGRFWSFGGRSCNEPSAMNPDQRTGGDGKASAGVQTR